MTIAAWYNAITHHLGLLRLAALTGVSGTILLLSGCQDVKPPPEPTLTPTEVVRIIPPDPTPEPTEVVRNITPEPNFAFALEWAYCPNSYTLNTFDNTLTFRIDMGTPTITKIEFALSRQDLERVYQKMVTIDLFSYPDEFGIRLPPKVIRVYGIGSEYWFDVRNGNQSKAVHWNDEYGEPRDMPWKAEDSEPSRTQATRLRELIELIREIVEARPEFNRLPSPGGCM